MEPGPHGGDGQPHGVGDLFPRDSSLAGRGDLGLCGCKAGRCQRVEQADPDGAVFKLWEGVGELLGMLLDGGVNALILEDGLCGGLDS